jgi:hypothetical protein
VSLLIIELSVRFRVFAVIAIPPVPPNPSFLLTILLADREIASVALMAMEPDDAESLPTDSIPLPPVIVRFATVRLMSPAELLPIVCVSNDEPFFRLTEGLPVTLIVPPVPPPDVRLVMPLAESESVSEAAIVIFPASPVPGSKLSVRIVDPFSCTVFAVMSISPVERLPWVEARMELPFASTMVSVVAGATAVERAASLTERTNWPPRIETVFVPLTCMVEPGARVMDP